MAGRYSIGETKVRPGIYFRETSDENYEIAGASNGVVAVAFKANWGPLGEVVTIESPADIYTYFGDDSGAGSNVGIINKIFLGGASVVKAIRVGTGGTKASITLKDTTEGAAVECINLVAKYAGTRALSVTIKDDLSVSGMRECVIYSGTRELTRVSFAKGAGEIDALIEAINSNSASVVIAAKANSGNGTLASLNQAEFTVAGVSPTIANQDYDSAFAMLEAEKWNVLCVDSNDTALHAIVKTFIKRANDGGLMGMAVVGEPTSVDYDTRKSHAAAFNSSNVIYALNGFTVGDEYCEGYVAAAVLSGLVAYLPASDSVTHKVIPNASSVIGPLTNTQIIECLQSGALVFTTSSSGAVWVEQGINTLVVLGSNQDAGWKKIRRTRTRFELIERINASTENIIGNVNNDSNGRATFIAIANGVIKEMIAEGKLVSGSAYEDSSNPAVGDSAWFVLDIRDLDSIERVYLTYMFHFAQE